MLSKAQSMEQLKTALLRKITEHGFALASSQEASGREAMSHTIGLWAATGHPELVVFGENLADAERCLNELGRRVMDGESFGPIAQPRAGASFAEAYFASQPMKPPSPAFARDAEAEPNVDFFCLSEGAASLPRAMAVWALGDQEAGSQWVEARFRPVNHASAALDWVAKEASRRGAASQAPAQAGPRVEEKIAFAQSYIATSHPQLSAAANAPKPSERLTFWAAARGAAIHWGERLLEGIEHAQPRSWGGPAWAWRPQRELSPAGFGSAPDCAPNRHEALFLGAQNEPKPDLMNWEKSASGSTDKRSLALDALNGLFDLPPTELNACEGDETDFERALREEAENDCFAAESLRQGQPGQPHDGRLGWRARAMALGAATVAARASREARASRRARFSRRKSK